MTQEELTCIGCPMGCRLNVKLDENGSFLSVEGYSCNIGKKYGEEEITHPTRMLTSLVRVKDRKLPLSVKTDKPVDKGRIFDCLREIAGVQAVPPVHIGDVILRDVCGSGSDVIATRELP